MRFQTPLIAARLDRRHKRFLADCMLRDGRAVTAHVANPGRMTGLADPGTQVWLEPVSDPRRKLPFAWRLAEPAPGVLVGVDTGAANRIAAEALEAGRVPGLGVPDALRREVTHDAAHRVDFVHVAGGRETLVEVKSVTLSVAPGIAAFPDAVTARGARHLDALARAAAGGRAAMVLYVVQRSDARSVQVAADIDPAYAAAAVRAAAQGVRFAALGCTLGPDGIAPHSPLPVEPQRGA